MDTCGQEGALVNPLQVCTLPDLLLLLLDAVVYLGTIFLTIVLVYVGFLFVKAQGKPEEIKKAREALLWTVIGGLLLLGASGLAVVIESTVGAI